TPAFLDDHHIRLGRSEQLLDQLPAAPRQEFPTPPRLRIRQPQKMAFQEVGFRLLEEQLFNHGISIVNGEVWGQAPVAGFEKSAANEGPSRSRFVRAFVILRTPRLRPQGRAADLNHASKEPGFWNRSPSI